jgi:NAD(P)-dependent dehydrogenase (short-subunit alcohol dehydrogenase family)
MSLLSGRTIVVTGAGGEIGRNHALELAALGARVVANEPEGPCWPTEAVARLTKTAQGIRDLGGEVVLDHADIATPDGAQALFDKAQAQLGTVHGLVNAAGTTQDRTLARMSIDDWDQVLASCLRSAFCMTSTAARYWRGLSQQGAPVKAAVLNRSSTSAMPGQPGQANYAAAMSGVATLSVTAAREGARYGMRVNCLCGPMDSAALRRASKMKDASGVPLGGDDWKLDARVLSPVMAALMAPDCPLTGQILFVGAGEIRTLEAWAPISSLQPADWNAAAITGVLSNLTLRSDDW